MSTLAETSLAQLLFCPTTDEMGNSSETCAWYENRRAFQKNQWRTHDRKERSCNCWPCNCSLRFSRWRVCSSDSKRLRI